MNKIFLPIRFILHLRHSFRSAKDLNELKNELREQIHNTFTNRDTVESYYYDIDEIFLRVMNMSLEDIIYSASAEIFNKNMVVEIKYDN